MSDDFLDMFNTDQLDELVTLITDFKDTTNEQIHDFEQIKSVSKKLLVWLKTAMTATLELFELFENEEKLIEKIDETLQKRQDAQQKLNKIEIELQKAKSELDSIVTQLETMSDVFNIIAKYNTEKTEEVSVKKCKNEESENKKEEILK
jgi:hypothetical protein